MRQEERAAVTENYTGVEDGSIYFFYRPVSSSAQQAGDVHRLYIVLHPLAQKKFRLISLDAARLPREGDSFNFVTGTVLKIDSKQYVIQDCLRQDEINTHGVPVLHRAAARACGEGVYSFVEFEDGLHLVYVLEIPRERYPVQRELGIVPEGNFLSGIINPYYSDPDEDQQNAPSFPQFPDPLKARLGNERVVHSDVEKYLDTVSAQLILYREESSAARQIKSRLHPLDDTCETSDIIRDLRLRCERHPVKPLFSGEWV